MDAPPQRGAARASSFYPKPRRKNLYFSIAAVNILFINCGCVAAWSSPVISSLHLKGLNASMVGAIVAFGAILGPWVNSILMGAIGKKPTMYITYVSFLVSWVTLASNSHLYVLLAGRLISGIAFGLATNILPVYITDITDVKVRQPARTIGFLFGGLGQMIVYTTGGICSYLVLQLVCMVPSLIGMVALSFVPESPYYLLEKNKHDKALKVLSWLRGLPEESVQSELAEIENRMKDASSIALVKLDLCRSMKTVFVKYELRRALFISLAGLIFQATTGYYSVVAYLEPFIVGNTFKLPFYQIGIIFSAFTIASAAFSPLTVMVLGIKNTLSATVFVMGLALIPIFLFSFLETEFQYNLDSIIYIPLCSLLIYNAAFVIGVGHLPRSIMAEITPPWARGAVSAISGSINWIVMFTLLLSVPWVVSAYPNSMWKFYISFSIFSLVGAIIILIVVPETRGLTLVEINALMKKK